jgi:hypothetical protein
MKLPVKNQDLYERLNENQKNLINNNMKKNIFGQMVEMVSRGEDVPEIKYDELLERDMLDGVMVNDIVIYRRKRGNEAFIERIKENTDEAELVAIVERLYDHLLKKYGKRLFQ